MKFRNVAFVFGNFSVSKSVISPIRGPHRPTMCLRSYISV